MLACSRRAARAVNLNRRSMATLTGNSASAFRAKLASRPRGVSMQFVVTPSPVVTQAVASAGADAIIVDCEHGPIDFHDAMGMIAAMKGSESTPLVRVSSICQASVKRSLDLGAEGIVFPLARSAADVQDAVASLRYPPKGVRGFGPFVASSCHDFDMLHAVAHYESNPPICYVLIETAEAVDDIAAIAAVEGVDVLQVAQFDLSTALGISGQFNHPLFLEAERHIEAAVLGARGASPALGAVALDRGRAHELHARGYRVIVGFDLWYLKQAIRDTKRWVEE